MSPTSSPTFGSTSYEEFYGFVQPPFTLTPDPRFLYRSGSHEEAITLLLRALRRKEGFIVLTGDIGTGKTTICRALLQQLDASTFTSLLLNPFLSVEELLREALLDFGVLSREAIRTGRVAAASTHDLVSTLHDFLLSLIPIRGSAVLIIDEAQHLSPQVLEQIRVLSNLETNEAKLLQIILVGQLNLLDILADSEMRQLEQRISIRATLKPLTRQEVEAYISHRLWVARGSTTVSFQTDAVDLVHRHSGGVPRIINLLCDRALMACATSREHEIAPDHVQQAAASLGLPPVARRRSLTLPNLPAGPLRLSKGSKIGAAVLLVVLAILAAVLYLRPVDTWMEVHTPTPPPRPPMRMKLPAVPRVEQRPEELVRLEKPRATAPRRLPPSETPDDFVAPPAPAAPATPGAL